jgi:hypothetical protein
MKCERLQRHRVTRCLRHGAPRQKKRHRPPLDENEVAIMIRNLAALGWIKVKPSESISAKVRDELYV